MKKNQERKTWILTVGYEIIDEAIVIIDSFLVYTSTQLSVYIYIYQSFSTKIEIINPKDRTIIITKIIIDDKLLSDLVGF